MNIYWWAGADGSRILMNWNVLTPGRELMGTYLEAGHLTKAIEYVESHAAFKAAYPYSVVGIFGKGGDDLETRTDEFVTVAKKQTTPERKIIVSNMVDFFEDFEKTYGATLPTFSAAFGNEWDLYPASVSELSARVRRSVEKLRAAEALASLVGVKQPNFLQGRREARDLAWMNLGIFWEHDWTADGLVARAERTAWGHKLADQIESYVDTLHSDAAAVLAGMIRTSPGSQRFYVFNPLGWTRSSAADVPYTGPLPIQVVDLTTGGETPSQMVSLPDGARVLRTLASDLPSVGYKVYEVQNGKGHDYSPAALVEGNVIENARYRVKVNGNGAIGSQLDKAQNNREFAAGSLNDLGSDRGRVEVENAGPVSVTLRATADEPLAHVSRITLFRDSGLIEIRNDINQNFDGTHTWGFNFKLTAPDVWHEESGAVIRARTLADGGHYSPTMSCLEWLTLNHFADMSGEDGTGVTLSSSDLAFMKLGGSCTVDGQPRLDTQTAHIQVLAGGQIDGSSLGIRKEGEDTHFLQRFGLRVHQGFNATQAMKFALEHQNPPVAAWLLGGTAYPKKSCSLLSISNPDLLLWALKPADDGVEKGLILRTWNLSTSPQPYSVSLTGGIASGVRASHIETDIAPLVVNNGAVDSRAERSQIQTLRLIPRENK
jgi:alpha-mannosidase